MWQDEWPTESGMWWFYGYTFKREGKENPNLHLVEVFRTSNSLAYTTHGGFLYKEEGAIGKWQKVTLPELPKMEVKR